MKALAVMLLTAAHRAFANDEVESADKSTSKLEENAYAIVDAFSFLDNNGEAISIPSNLLLELI